MNSDLRMRLIGIAQSRAADDDPSHDWLHISRVLKNVEFIGAKEGGDSDILIPSALFHDVVNPPKNDPRAAYAADQSAVVARDILQSLSYPQQKIPYVEECIRSCSFSKGIVPNLLEGKILQDADMLESTGVISIMRTFASTGNMRRPLYHPGDPFCEGREPENLKYAVDLFYSRLLKVQDRFHTETAREMGKRRTAFLYVFLDELKHELQEQ